VSNLVKGTTKGAVAALALAGGFVLAAAAAASTSALVWTSRPPAIDGAISAGEWDGSVPFALADEVSARVSSDARTLYVRLIDARQGEPGGDRMILFFDDDGGPGAVLDDGEWGAPACQGNPALGEGELWIPAFGPVEFYEWVTDGGGSHFCPAQPLSDGLRSAVGLVPGIGVVYEVAIPLDGPAPLGGAPGRRFGLQLRAVDGSGLGEVCFPSCSLDPAVFQPVVLASGGCNTGPQTFGSGPPWEGLPLDWTSHVNIGDGEGWIQSLLFGDPVFCQDNVTGGSGAAACTANALYTQPLTRARLDIPLNLAGQGSVTVRARAYLLVDPNGEGESDYLDISVRRQDGTDSSELFWGGADQSGPLALPLALGGNPPVELWFTHLTFSAGGLEGGFAQIDDVELLCGPILFADGFESGLATHWTGQSP
jgi:hypothetical protein